MRSIEELLQIPEHRGGPNLRWNGHAWERFTDYGTSELGGSSRDIIGWLISDWPEGAAHDAAHADWLAEARSVLGRE